MQQIIIIIIIIIKRGVTCALLGLLKTSRAAAFWIICKGLIVFDGSPARRALQ